MDDIHFVQGIGALGAAEILALSDGEPAYFYDRDQIHARIAALRAVFPPALKLAYSLKANPFAPLVGTLIGRLDGADVTSHAELVTALNAGARPRDIMFAGPAKKPAELRAAVALGVGVCVESLREMQALARIAADLGRPARVLLRVNPEFSLSGASMRMGGAPTQFGLNAEDLQAVWPLFDDPNLRFAGIHIYWGSQCLSEAAILEAQEASVAEIEAMAARFPNAPELLNLGGGFGIPYSTRDKSLDLALIGQNFAPLMDRLTARFPGTDLFLELGRYLVGEAGSYVSVVVDKKVSHGVTFIVTNGGMHHFLAASGNLGQRIRRNYPIRAIANPARDPEVAPAIGTDYEIVGALCTPIDLLGHRLHGPALEIGDLVVIGCAGAYGKSASPLDFLSHPHPREFLI